MNSSRYFFKSAFNSAKSSGGQRAFFTSQRRTSAAFTFNLSSA